MALAKKDRTFEPIIVRPDSKGRITLGRFANGVSSFVVSQDDDGRLLLEPYKEVPAREAWLFENPEAIGKVRQGLADLAADRLVDRGDFSQYVEYED